MVVYTYTTALLHGASIVLSRKIRDRTGDQGDSPFRGAGKQKGNSFCLDSGTKHNPLPWTYLS